MDGTEFDPGTGAGAAKITALVLPDAAESIKAGTNSSNATFKAFTALASISGAGVETVGQYAFYGCASLTEVDLPVAGTIGAQAFRGCTGLETVSLLEAVTIGDSAFQSCGAALTEVYLPKAQTIGSYAFELCSGLASVNLSAAETIGNFAFSRCTGLTSLSLPTVPPSIGTSIFYNTGSSGTIVISVPTGTVTTYTSAWSVSADTYANDSFVYGDNHKAVTITDAAQ
jgi:hypothetical protein